MLLGGFKWENIREHLALRLAQNEWTLLKLYNFGGIAKRKGLRMMEQHSYLPSFREYSKFTPLASGGKKRTLGHICKLTHNKIVWFLATFQGRKNSLRHPAHWHLSTSSYGSHLLSSGPHHGSIPIHLSFSLLLSPWSESFQNQLFNRLSVTLP